MRWSQTPADTFLLTERLTGQAERRPAPSPLVTGNVRHAFSSTCIRSSRGLKEGEGWDRSPMDLSHIFDRDRRATVSAEQTWLTAGTLQSSLCTFYPPSFGRYFLLEQLNLPIAKLDERHPGLTPAVAESLHEAARVCLDRYHQSPASFSLHHSESAILVTPVEWEVADARCQAAHAYETKATEEGACACLLAAVEIAHGLVAVSQAEAKSGADYYIQQAGQPVVDLEECLRLEVSGIGIDGGNESAVEARLRQKLQQALSGRSNLPALAGVVGFKARLIKIRQVET